jgi:twitching motility protein PilT
MFDPKLQQEFETRRSLDFGLNLEGVCRFRVNVFVQSNGVAIVLRVVPPGIPTPEQLALTPSIVNLANLPRGLVLVTGATGSGKSSTIAAMLEHVNIHQSRHILTIEDPIEFVYQSKNSMVNQREIGEHADSFGQALRYALRQNPDIIMVGEMRDMETIQLAMGAAETGHLCLSTLHTQDAATTVGRIITEFPAEQQQKVCAQLCNVLSAVVSQVLLPRKGGGLVCAREVMIMNPAVSSLIREGKANQIYGAIESGASWGMVSLDQHLVQLVKTGQVEMKTALAKAHDPQSLQNRMEISGGLPPAAGPQDARSLPR